MTTTSPAVTALGRLRRMFGSPGWPRTVALRRLIAAVLVLVAAALAVAPRAPDPPRPPGEPRAALLVAARDLGPGISLAADDVRVVLAPPTLVPKGALANRDAATGRMLASAASTGEPITEARLVGPESTRLALGGATPPDTATVPVRLADPGVAELLLPGSHVDIVAVDQQGADSTVLASDAVVLTTRPSGHDADDRGQLVVLALPRAAAATVAAMSLHRMMTVTLR